MRIKQLEYLLKIVECGSMTKAAKQLYISQPNLTKSMHQLEEEYNITIFVRKPRGVELTAEGKNFVYYAKSVITAIQALSDNCKTVENVPYSRLFLATQQLDFVYDIFLKIYLRAGNAPIHFNLIETNRNDVVKQVLNENADCGLFVRNSSDAKMFHWNTDASRLSMEVLDTGGSYVCVGPKSPFYHSETVTQIETQIYTQVMLDMENAARRDLYFDNHFAMHQQKQIIFFNTIDACKQFILQTDAVLYLSEWSRGYFEYPSFHILPLLDFQQNGKPVVNELVWVRRLDMPLSPTEEVFLTYLKQYLEKSHLSLL